MKKIILICILLLIMQLIYAETFINLNDAIELAKENNYTLKSSFYEMESARWSSRNSKTQFLPKLNLNQTAVILDKERILMPEIDLGGAVIPETKQDRKNFNTSIQLEQILFAGGKIYNASKIAELQYEISKNNYGKQLKELSAKVTEYYYQILKTQAILRTLQIHKNLCEEIKSNAEVLYNNGIGLETDVMQWELKIIEIENQIIQTDTAMKLLLDNWALVLNLDSTYDIPLPQIIELEDISAEISSYMTMSQVEKREQMLEYLEKVQKGNYDIDNLQKGKQTLNHLDKIAKADFMPSLFVSMNYEIENDNKLNFKGDDNWQIMANISIPLFHSGRNYTNYKAQQYQIKSQLSQIEENTKGLDILAKQAWYDHDSSSHTVKQSKKSYSLAEKALNITRRLYQQGMATNLALTEAQSSFQDSEIQYTNSIYDYIINKSNLNKFTGEVK